MRLTGERVELREFELGDALALAAVHSDPRVMCYYAPEVATLEHAEMLVERFVAWANERPRRNFQLAIVDASTGELLGSCGVRSAHCPLATAEFGIGIASSAWGKGIAHEASRLILDFAFRELGLREIYGVAVAQNEAVTGFVQRLGFAARPARHTEPWVTEGNWTAVEWVITRDEW